MVKVTIIIQFRKAETDINQAHNYARKMSAGYTSPD